MNERTTATNKQDEKLNLQKFYFNRILFYIYIYFEGKSVLDTQQALLRDFWFNEAGVD